MLIVDSYTTAALQTIAALLAQSEAAGLSVRHVAEMVQSELARREAPAPTTGHRTDPCPSCHRGHLVVWPLISREVGGLVVGCRLCMYSRVEVGDGDSAR